MRRTADVSLASEVDIPVALPQDLIDQINAIVPGRPATAIKDPGLVSRTVGAAASIGARLSIWFDTNIYSMLVWWGMERTTFAQILVHAAFGVAMWALTGSIVKGIVIPVGVGLIMSVPIAFVLFAFEYSLMGKNERRVVSFQEGLDRKIGPYEKGTYEIGVYHNQPYILMCAFLWPLMTCFIVLESVAHALLVVRDYALGNRYGSFVLLPTDWVEFYKEVPLKDYTGFIPQSLKRRLEQVVNEHDGETFVLVPFGLMPENMPGIDKLADAHVRWDTHIQELQRPQGDPVLAVRLKDSTRYGRMLVVGHWLTLATTQKTNLLYRQLSLEVKRVQSAA